MPDIPEPNYVALGIKIAQLRRDKGWSIDRLAQESHVSRKSIINVEGARHEPKLSTTFALAHGPGVEFPELLQALCEGEMKAPSK